MHEQSKIVTSRGTTYAGSYPLVPTLYPAGKPLVIAAIALSTILIVLIQNKTFSTMDAKLQASVLYSCFYLFVLGSLARIIISRPPHKVVVGIATAPPCIHSTWLHVDAAYDMGAISRDR